MVFAVLLREKRKEEGTEAEIQPIRWEGRQPIRWEGSWKGRWVDSRDARPTVQDYADGRGPKIEARCVEINCFKEPLLLKRPRVLRLFHLDPGVLDLALAALPVDHFLICIIRVKPISPEGGISINPFPPRAHQ